MTGGAFAFPKTLSSQGTPYHTRSGPSGINASQTITLINETVPATGTRTVNQVRVVCRFDGTATFKVNGSVVSRIKTSPTNQNVPRYFIPGKPIAPGATYTVDFQSNPYNPTSVDVDVEIDGSDQVI